MTGVRTTHLPILLLVAGAFCGRVDAFVQFEGHLEAVLEISNSQQVTLQEGKPPLLGSPSPCAGIGQCFEGTLELGRRTYLPTGATIRIVQLERAGSAPLLYADLNRDGALGSEEQGTFVPTSSGTSTWDVVLRFPSEKAAGGYFAHLFRVVRSESDSSSRILQVADEVSVRGLVNVDGRSVLVKLPYDLVRDRVELRNGYLGMDCDGDGSIDTGPASPEYTYARDENVVFRIGSHYVSAKLASRRSQLLLLQEHPPGEYERIELQRGATIPNFEFRDSSGAVRRLQDLQGNYTLLFLWGIGCGAWPGDVPTINDAMARFAGFSVVGISDGADDDAIRRRMRETGARWTQAAASDGRKLYLKRFRVWASPTLVLIDGERRIVSRNLPGELPLRDAGLLSTLKLLLGEPNTQVKVQ